MERKDWIYLCIVFLIAILAYSNIFSNDFTIDDSQFILQDHYKELTNIPKFFTGEVSSPHTGEYRPITLTLYTINGYLWNKNPLGYHIQSLVFHLISVFLVYRIAQFFFKEDYAPFFVSLIYAIHPLQTEVVTQVTSTFDLAGIWYLSCLFCFFTYTESKNRVHLRLAYLFCMLAFFTYELSVSLPLVLIAYGLIQRKYYWKEWGIFLSILVGFLCIRFFFIHTVVRGFPLPLSVRVMFSTLAIGLYVKKLILPDPALRDYLLPNLTTDSGDLLVEQVTNLQQYVLPVVLIVFGIVALLYLVYRSKNTPLAFGLALVALSIFPGLKIGDNPLFFAERYAHMAVLGFAIAVYAVIKKWRRIVPVLLLLLLVFYIPTTHQRNKDWKNIDSITQATLEKVPENRLMLYAYGEHLYSMKQFEESRLYFEAILDLPPTYFDSIDSGGTYTTVIKTNLGEIAYFTGDYDQALRIFEELIYDYPESYYVHDFLSRTYEKVGNFTKAEKHVKLSRIYYHKYKK